MRYMDFLCVRMLGLAGILLGVCTPLSLYGQEVSILSEEAKRKDRELAKEMVGYWNPELDSTDLEFVFVYEVRPKPQGEYRYGHIVPNAVDSLWYGERYDVDSLGVRNYCARIAQGIPLSDFFYVPVSSLYREKWSMKKAIFFNMYSTIVRMFILRRGDHRHVGSMYYPLAGGFSIVATEYTSSEERLFSLFLLKKREELGIEYFFFPGDFGLPLMSASMLLLGVDDRQQVYLFDTYRQEVTYVGGPPVM